MTYTRFQQTVQKWQKLRIFGAILTNFSIALIIVMVWVGVVAKYQYQRDYRSYWSLADKASTIPQKSDYINQFVERLEISDMKDEYNAVFQKTPDNSFNKNLEALKSLQTRLQEIKLMDPKSFEYNTAITQITAQEQGEAAEMLRVFSGIWWKTNYFMLWNWVGTLNVFIVLTMLFLGIRYWNYGNW